MTTAPVMKASSLIVLVLLGTSSIRPVVASRKTTTRQQKQQRTGSGAAIPSLLEDEFGRLHEEVQDLSRTKRRTSSSSSINNEKVNDNNIKPSRLRRAASTQKQQEPRPQNDEHNRNLLTQRWEAVSRSYQDSVHHQDGLIEDDVLTPRLQFGLEGINQHARMQQLEAMFDAEQLQAIMSSMSMGMPSGSGVSHSSVQRSV